MSAAARAEARRKAILSQKTDRLAKLTTSARGEDALLMPNNPSCSAVQNTLTTLDHDDILMPAPSSRKSLSPSPSRTICVTPTDVDPTLPPMDNPFAAIFFPKKDGGFPPASMSADEDVVKSAHSPYLQKWMPLIHLLATWFLLAYFVLYLEPQTHRTFYVNFDRRDSWKRWAQLGRTRAVEDAAQFLTVQVVPIFWAFVMLQILLHSVRIIYGFDPVQPPNLLAMIFLYLPPPLPATVVNLLKYLQMTSLFFNDLSGLVVGMGLVVMFSGWFSNIL